jgi:hypothetical protein
VQVEHLRQRAKELRAVRRAANAAVHAASPEGQIRLRRTSVSAEERAQGYRWQDRRGYLANEKRAIERLTVEEPRRRRMGSL